MQKNFFGGFSPIAIVLLLISIAFGACKKDEPLELPKEEPVIVQNPTNSWGTGNIVLPGDQTRYQHYRDATEYRRVNGLVGGSDNALIRQIGNDVQGVIAPSAAAAGQVEQRDFTWTTCGTVGYRTFHSDGLAAYQKVGVALKTATPNVFTISEKTLSTYFNSTTGKYTLVVPANGTDCAFRAEMDCTKAFNDEALWVSAIDGNGAMIVWDNLWVDPINYDAITDYFGAELAHLIFYFPTPLFTMAEVENQEPFAKMACGAASVINAVTTAPMSFVGNDCLQAGGTPTDAVTVNNFHYLPNFVWQVNGGTQTAYTGSALALNLQTAQNNVEIDTLYRTCPRAVQADTLVLFNGQPFGDPAFYEVQLWIIERDPASGQLQQKSNGTAFRRINQPFYLRKGVGPGC